MKFIGFAAFSLLSISVALADPSSTGGNPNLSPPASSESVFGSPCAYPDTALRSGIVGRTSLEFHIMPSGEIADITVVDSSGSAELDNAAMRCVSRWRENPNLSQQPRLVRGTISWTIPATTGERTSATASGLFRNLSQVCQYPPAAISANAEGTTKVLVHITADGEVSGVDIIQSSGNTDLDQATITCVQESWHFQPARQDGKPVAATKMYALQWKMNPDEPPQTTLKDRLDYKARGGDTPAQ